MFLFGIILSLVLLGSTSCQRSPWHNPNCDGNRRAIVHLFEWKWPDIADECERFLGPRGFCGVQVSPANEHVMVNGRPWWERYQPVSYKLHSRSGTEEEFIDMVERCNNVGVRIYIDAIINHMSGMGRNSEDEPGSGGSDYDADEGSFPAVPFTMDNFNGCETCPACCCINAWQDHQAVRNCRLVGLIDLKQDNPDTQAKIEAFMNRLIDLGVAGFRIDAAKHMWPDDLEAIWNNLHTLNTRWFPEDSNAFIFLEVIDMNQQGEVNVHEYTHLGRVTEFRFCTKVAQAADALWDIPGIWDPGWGMCHPDDAFTFVDNHDNQRGHGAGGEVLTYQNPTKYMIAQAITLGYTYGYPRIMSSFDFNGDTERGPPADQDGNTDDIPINADGSCGGDWICEHRWPAIAGMAGFAKATNGEPFENWWNDGNQAAWSRGNKGFVAITNNGGMTATIQTGLPGGEYCNVIEGCATETGCQGQSVTVNGDGTANIQIMDANSPILAIHVEAMSGSNQCVSGGGEPPPQPTGDPTTAPPTTTTPGPTTTRDPDAPPAEKTVIYVRMETQPGQDMFVRGGIDHDRRPGCTEDAETSACAITISHNSLGSSEHYEKHNAWSEGDTKLDWYGVQVGQGSWSGNMAHGTPAAWTTNRNADDGYQSDNDWGDHYWKIDVDMDCDETEDGWFEFKGYVTNGVGWEFDINQAASCDGNVGGSIPFASNNHMGRCGYRNMFVWNTGECTIDAI